VEDRSKDNMLKYLIDQDTFCYWNNTDNDTPIGMLDGTRTRHTRPDSGQPESHKRGTLLSNLKYLVFNFIFTSITADMRKKKENY